MPMKHVTKNFILCDDREHVSSAIRYIASRWSLGSITKSKLQEGGKKYGVNRFLSGETTQLELLMPDLDLAYSHDGHKNQYVAVDNGLEKSDPNYKRIHIYTSTEVKGTEIPKAMVDISRTLMDYHLEILETLEQHLVKIDSLNNSQSDSGDSDSSN